LLPTNTFWAIQTISCSFMKWNPPHHFELENLVRPLGYLAIFNRPSHRSLHDLATATMVVRLAAELPTARPMRRFRWGAVAIFLALGALAPVAGLLATIALVLDTKPASSLSDLASSKFLSL